MHFQPGEIEPSSGVDRRDELKRECCATERPNDIFRHNVHKLVEPFLLKKLKNIYTFGNWLFRIFCHNVSSTFEIKAFPANVTDIMLMSNITVNFGKYL